MAQLEQTQRVARTELYIGTEDAGGYTLVNLPCLGGDGACRRPERKVFAVADGKLYIAGWWEPLEITQGETLCGWGHLDGPSYRVGGVDVPESVMRHLVGHFGLDFSPVMGVD